MLHADGLIEGMTFLNEDHDGETLKLLEMAECTVEKCTFRQSNLMNGDFRDVIFCGADFSGCNLSRASFRGVRFENCRLIGADMAECFMQNTVFSACNGEYLNLSNAKIKKSEFLETKLKKAFLENVQLDGTVFAQCDLTESEWFKTRMKGLDLRTCELMGLSAGGFELNGAVIDAAQAAYLIGLFGIKVK